MKTILLSANSNDKDQGQSSFSSLTTDIIKHLICYLAFVISFGTLKMKYSKHIFKEAKEKEKKREQKQEKGSKKTKGMH